MKRKISLSIIGLLIIMIGIIQISYYHYNKTGRFLLPFLNKKEEVNINNNILARERFLLTYPDNSTIYVNTMNEVDDLQVSSNWKKLNNEVLETNERGEVYLPSEWTSGTIRIEEVYIPDGYNKKLESYEVELDKLGIILTNNKDDKKVELIDSINDNGTYNTHAYSYMGNTINNPKTGSMSLLFPLLFIVLGIYILSLINRKYSKIPLLIIMFIIIPVYAKNTSFLIKAYDQNNNPIKGIKYNIYGKPESKKEKVKPTTAEELVDNINLGYNLGNALDAMHKEWGYTLNTEWFWHNPNTTKEMIDRVKELGFNTIRIPVSYYNHIDTNGVIDPLWLQRVEEVVGWALDNDLYTIINIHHDTGMGQSLFWIYADSDNYEENRDKFVNLWTQIADYFKDYDDRLIFQSSGEWMNSIRSWSRSRMEDFKIVHDLNQEFINTVRNSGSNNSNRFLMLSPFSASAEDDILRAMFYKPFTDIVENKLIISVHNYSKTEERIKYFVNILKNVQEEYGMPIVIDEMGTSTEDDYETRKLVYELYITEALKNGIKCMHWDDGDTYVLFDRNTLEIENEELLNIMKTSAGIL